MTDNNRQNRRFSNVDLEETIQFTQEDLRKMREPNRQPIDGDYFTEQLIDNNAVEQNVEITDEKILTEPISDNSSADFIEEQPNEIPVNQPKLYNNAEHYSSHEELVNRPNRKQQFQLDDDMTIDSADFNEDYLIQAKEVLGETSLMTDPLHQQMDESKEQLNDNPFKYQSVAKKLRTQYEAEKQKELQAAQERRERLMKKFEDTYEPIYDENNIADLGQYNQFNLDTDGDEHQNSSQAPSENNNKQSKNSPLNSNANKDFEKNGVEDQIAKLSLGTYLGQIKNSVMEKFNKSHSEQESKESDQNKEGILSKIKSKVKKSDDLSDELTVTQADETLEEEERLKINADDFSNDNSMQFSEDNVKSDKLAASSLDRITKDSVEEISNQISQATQAFDGPILTDQVLEATLGNEDLILNELNESNELTDPNELTESNKPNEPNEEEASFVKGTAWLTAGNIISRVLGALYVIPWGTWFGTSYTTANALYGIGYNPYALFLAVSTGGFPSAIAKQMAFYHSKKQYKSADKIFKNSLLVMLVSGVLAGALLYLLAPSIAGISSTDNPAAAVVVIRSLTPALVILPIMSLLRGYFQGFGDMVPTAVSQILEQIARVIYMLAATYAVMKLLTGDVTIAVAHSTFAAFIGALISLVYLVFLYFRRRSAINLLIETAEEDNADDLDFKASLIILLKDSIPFILLGSGIIIAKFIDQISFKFVIESTSTMLLSDISELFGVLNLDVDKLIMIIISIAVGMSLSSIPLITRLYANHEQNKTGDLIERISILFLLVMSPAAFGMASISNNVYQFFYPFGHEQGPAILITASFLSIVLGAYTILSTIIQSMNYRRAAINYLLIGLAVKVVLQFPLVAWLHAHGALIATLLAFLVTSILMLWKLHELVHLDFKGMLPDVVIIYSATLIMGLSASFWNNVLDLAFGPVGRILTLVKILIVIVIAAFIYFGVLALFGKLSLLFGNKNHELQEKLRMF